MTSPHIVVIIDDEPQIRKILKILLEQNSIKVIEAANAAEGVVALSTCHPSLLLLDLGLPDKDGLDLLKELREWMMIPIIILSVKNSERDIVGALDAGADDYITKPFNSSELVARIRANLRKVHLPVESVFETGTLKVDFSGHLVYKNGEEVKLTAMEFSLLALFIRNQGKVLTHRYILKEVWGQAYEEQVQNLRVFVAQLRKKIEDENSEYKMIRTESGIGYRFVAFR